MPAEMQTVSATFLSNTLFETDVDAPGVMSRSLPVLLAGIGRRTYLPMTWVHRLPLPMNRRFAAARQELDSLVLAAIAEYRANPGDRGDLLSMFMAAVDEDGVGLTDQQLHDEVCGMMFAAVATTSEGLTWVFHALTKHPEVEKKVAAEIDDVLGGRTVTFADLPALEYTKRALTEVLRVYPPGWILTPHSVRAAVVQGHEIPAGSDVF